MPRIYCGVPETWSSCAERVEIGQGYMGRAILRFDLSRFFDGLMEAEVVVPQVPIL